MAPARIKEMSHEDIQAEAAKAYKEHLLVRYSLIAKSQRETKILVHLGEDYMVVCTFSAISRPVVILFSQIKEMTAVPDDPTWKRPGGQSLAEIIIESMDRYTISQSLQAKAKAKLIEAKLMQDQITIAFSRQMLNKLKEAAPFSTNPEKFLDNIEELLSLI